MTYFILIISVGIVANWEVDKWFSMAVAMIVVECYRKSTRYLLQFRELIQ